MEKVIPPGLNYADIKPEAIENQIRIIKYTPVATTQIAAPNDVIRFHLQGNGFFDPYSAYLKLEVDFGVQAVNNQGSQFWGKFLDRSAHSFINRMVIRSQGTELERVENYDILAGIINDMMYSSEQRTLHHYEGFACKTRSTYTTTGIMNDTPIADNEANLNALPLLVNNGFDTLSSHYGDVGSFTLGLTPNAVADSVAVGTLAAPSGLSKRLGQDPQAPIGIHNGLPYSLNSFAVSVENSIGAQAIPANPGLIGNLGPMEGGYWKSPSKFVFCIPIYSGIIGVLMPEKKFLPLSLLPLEVEFTVNPHALYCAGACDDRRFSITKAEIFCHTLFFEQELHRSLEAVVAETGIFLHYNSFYLAPINTFNQGVTNIGGYSQIGVYLKSINSLHWAFIYDRFQTDSHVRKLHFCSHTISQLQLRNGMDLIPSEPIQGMVGGSTLEKASVDNRHVQFLIETYKAWNKMHDPLSDSAINKYNYQLDFINSTGQELSTFLKSQYSVGRCQYGLTLEGEELGNQKHIVTGKRSVMPFDLNWSGIKRVPDSLSYMMLYLRADFIIYVRPDLVVTRLGL